MADRDARPADRSTRVAEALRLLAEEARARLERHPWGHLLSGRRDELPLTLALPTRVQEGTGAPLAERAAEASRGLDEALQALLGHRSAIRPGAVFCLRCGSAGCDHAMPGSPREVFAGYGGTGIPRFADFGQLLLEQKDPRVDALYRGAPALLTLVTPGRDLTRDLLPVYRDGETGYRIHGQVAAGWFRVPDPTGRPHTLAVTLQIVSTRPQGATHRRFSVNVLGLGPEGEPLEHLHDRLREIPWAESVRWAQGILDGVQRTTSRSGKTGKTSKRANPQTLKRRLDGILASIARRLERGGRSQERKTRHAQERHAQGDRPTPMALPDLARAQQEQILVDVRQETLVVLGERGRAHVFSPEGKHVTSVRYNPASIERRRERGLWRPAKQEEAAALRAAVAGQGADAG